MDDLGADLLVLLFGDPVALKGGQGREDRSSDPDGELPLRWCDDLDLGVARRDRLDLLLEPLGIIGEHSAPSRKCYILKEGRS